MSMQNIIRKFILFLILIFYIGFFMRIILYYRLRLIQLGLNNKVISTLMITSIWGKYVPMVTLKGVELTSCLFGRLQGTIEVHLLVTISFCIFRQSHVTIYTR